MTTLATSDLNSADIRSILSFGAGESKVQELNDHVNVDKFGLDPTYCSGDDADARLANLQSSPHYLGKFRGYTDPPEGWIAVDHTSKNIPRCVSGETLHSSLTWDMGLKHYSAAGTYGGGSTVFNTQVRINDTEDLTTIAYDYGNTNISFGDYQEASPDWTYRYTDESGSFANGLAAGNYYIIWSMSNSWLSSEYKDAGGHIYCPITIYDYLICDPDQFNLFEDASSESFEIWTGVSTVTSIVSGSAWITLTGATSGVGNRTQGFDVSANIGTTRNGQIQVSGPGVTTQYIDIEQLGEE